MEENQTTQPESNVNEVKQENVKVAAPSMDADIKKNKDIAGLSYIPPISIFVYLFKKDSKFINENAKQGVALFAILVLGWLIGMIPGIGFIGWILLIVSFIFIILGFLKAFNDGETLKIPMLSAYLAKHDFSDIIDSAKSQLEAKTQQATDAAKTAATVATDKAQQTTTTAAKDIEAAAPVPVKEEEVKAEETPVVGEKKEEKE